MSDRQRPKGSDSRLTRRELVVKGGIATAALGLGPLLAACGGDGGEAEGVVPADTPPAAAGTTAASTTAAAGQSIVVAHVDVPITFDTENANSGQLPSGDALTNLLDTLIVYKFTDNPDGTRSPDFTNFEGHLAEAWEASDDQKVWTFHLRQGVVSAWGNELTADDYIWSVERAIASKFLGLFMLDVGGITAADQVKKIDDYTIQFTVKVPRSTFLHSRASHLMAILDSTEVKKHATSDDPWASEWVSANGGGFAPYMVDKLVPQQEFVMKANPGHFFQPKIETVTFRSVPSSSTRLAALASGTVDVAIGLAPTELKSLEGNSSVKIVNALDGNKNIWLLPNQNFGPLRDKRVRQAIAYAIPYDDIVDAVFFGQAQPYTTFTAPSYPEVTDKFWHYQTDPDRAKALLADAGHADGFKVRMEYLGETSIDELVAIQVRDALGQIGINATLEKVTAAIFTQHTTDPAQRAKTQLVLSSQNASWVPDLAYAADFMFKSGAFLNPFWKNTEFDALAAQSIVEPDATARTKQLTRMQEILSDEMPNIPIVLTGSPIPMKSDIQGYSWFPDNYVRYAYMYRA